MAARFAIVAVLLYSTGLFASFASAQGIDSAWIDDVASAEEISAYYSGDGELEDAARQSVALHTLYRYSGLAIREKIGRDWTAREEAYREDLDVAETAIDDRIRERYGRASAEYLEYQDIKNAFRNDARNRLDILERFAPPIAAIMKADLDAEVMRQAAFRQKGAIGGLIIISAAIAFVYLLVTSIADKRNSFGLSVEETDDKTIVRYKPGRHGVSTVFAVYGSYIAVGLFVGVLAAIAAVMFAVSRDYEWMEQPIPEWLLPVFTEDFWWIVLLVLLATPIWLLAIANFARRRQQEVVITRKEIQGRGGRLEKERIGQMYIWGIGNGEGVPEEQSTVLIGGNAAFRAAAAGQLHGAHMRGSFRKIRRRLGRVSNQVCVDYGEHRRAIASRLPFERARLVLEAVERAASRLQGRVEVGGIVTTSGD
jgi:hypothetical protein